MKLGALAVILDSVPRRASIQMAIDEVLLKTTTIPILRCYTWLTTCATIGYFERFVQAQALFPELELTRRWTGGGTVIHGSDWPYTLIVPRSEELANIRPIESYQFIHQSLAGSMNTQKQHAHVIESPEETHSCLCFERPVAFDIVVDSKKVAGAAQRRSRDGFMHQGSVQHPDLQCPDIKIFSESLAETVKQASISQDIVQLSEKIATLRYENKKWLRSR